LKSGIHKLKLKLKMKNILILIFISLLKPLVAQLPNTDIWLMDIKADKDTIILSNPVNITNRTGYDNQPSFSPDGKYLLYTSIRDEKQSDIYKYDLKTKQISQFCNTPATSEYSPTFMPDGKNVSVVMVEPDSTQRLWKFPLKGGAPSLVMDKVDSIGYHCWITTDSLALIMITEPPTLQLVNKQQQQPILISRNAGRSMQSFPDSTLLYMTKGTPGSESDWSFRNSKVRYNQICTPSPMTLPEEIQDFRVYHFKQTEPIIFFGYKNKLIGLEYFSGRALCEANLTTLNLKISRIAISPDGTKMAIVAE
jgi:dipeptidyl aminopeptidase/acylaminoacyl peptidase